MLVLIFIYCIAHQSAGQARNELFAGWNHLVNLGVSGNSNFALNPKVGQEGNTTQLGINFDISNINIDTDYIFENKLELNIGLSKNSSNTIELDSSSLITPFKKNYDYLILKTKYSKQIKYSKNYIAAESHLNTQFLPSYTDNYIKQHSNDFTLLSEFLSPLISTFSIGYERRNDFDYVIYFSPITSKVIFVNNQELAGRPALNESRDSTVYLGSSLHGNELEYDEELQEVTSFSKTRFFFGSQLTLEFNKDIIQDKLLLQTESRLFYNYNGPKKHLDIQIRASVQFTLFKGLSLGLTAEYIDDDNLFFQDSSNNQRSSSSNILKRGVSYNHRFVLTYALSK